MRQVLPVLFVLTSVLTSAFAAAIGVVVLTSGSCSFSLLPVTTIQVYQIKRDAAGAAPLPAADFVPVLDRRVNPGWGKAARIRSAGDDRIEVGIYGRSPERAKRIQRLVEAVGKLEFRILANERDHASTVRLARVETGNTVRDRKGDAVGWWVTVAAGVAADLQNDPDTICRTVNRDGEEQLEILLVDDQWKVAGSDIQRAWTDSDFSGRTVVHLLLKDEGAQKLAALTNDNLPDPTGNFRRKLGVVLDRRLVAATAIVGTLYNDVEIDGRFSVDEAQDIAATLSGGALPVPLRLLSENQAQP